MSKDRIINAALYILAGVLLANAGWEWGSNRPWAILLIVAGGVCAVLVIAVGEVEP